MALQNFNSVHHNRVQLFHHGFAVAHGIHLNVHVLSVARQAESKGSRKGHDLVGAESLAVFNINAGTPYGLLKIPHDIEMTDKFNGALLRELNSYFHSRHLLQNASRRRQNISVGSSALIFHQWRSATLSLRTPWKHPRR